MSELKKFHLEEINQMKNAILNGDLKTTETSDYGLIKMIKESDKENELSFPLHLLAEKKAIQDLKTIKEALELLHTYEKAGVKFEFINHKTSI